MNPLPDTKVVEGIEVRRIWDCDFYWVSKDGRVWSDPRWLPGKYPSGRNIKGRWLKWLWKESCWYVSLGKLGKYGIHQLVALMWIGHPPFTGALVRHIDDDPSNNQVSNLRYGTQKENMADRYENGKIFCYGRIKSFDHLKAVYLAAKEGQITSVAKQFNLPVSTIRDIKFKKRWTRFTSLIDKELVSEPVD